MLDMEAGYKYTITTTYNIRETSKEYPLAKIILLADKDESGMSIIAIKERR